jgi:hypothetical protein
LALSSALRQSLLLQPPARLGARRLVRRRAHDAVHHPPVLSRRIGRARHRVPQDRRKRMMLLRQLIRRIQGLEGPQPIPIWRRPTTPSVRRSTIGRRGPRSAGTAGRVGRPSSAAPSRSSSCPMRPRVPSWPRPRRRSPSGSAAS